MKKITIAIIFLSFVACNKIVKETGDVGFFENQE
jgi:hypothetical protein